MGTNVKQLFTKRTPLVYYRPSKSLILCNEKKLPVPPCGINEKINVQKNQILTFYGGKAAMWVSN
jgi:hypothetical protein